MKPIKKVKKLALNKESLRTLTADALNDVNGALARTINCNVSDTCSTDTALKCGTQKCHVPTMLPYQCCKA